MIAVVVGDQGVALLHRIQHVIVVDIVEQRSVEAPRRERPVVGILRGADGQTGGQADQRKLHLKKKTKKNTHRNQKKKSARVSVSLGDYLVPTDVEGCYLGWQRIVER